LEIYEKAELISYCCATSNIADPTVQNKVKLIGHSQIVFSMLHKLVYCIYDNFPASETTNSKPST